MSISYPIQASVVDISRHLPNRDDDFVVDTNVWYWMTYQRASMRPSKGPADYQIQSYPSYLKKAMIAGANLYRCEVSFSELANTIENAEMEIAKINFSVPNIKDFRYNWPEQHKKAIEEVNNAWFQMKTIAKSVELTLSEPCNDATMLRMKSFPLACCDLYIYQSMCNKRIENIITDDGDFSAIPGIKVFTANRNVLSLARSAKKLVNG